MSQFQNVTSMTDFIRVGNNMTDGLLVFSFVICIQVVFFLTSYRFGTWKALTYSSFIVILLEMILKMVNLVQDWMIILSLVTLAIGIFQMLATKISYS